MVEKIRELCEERNMTLKSLEEALEIGNGVIARWDKSSPRLENIAKVAEYFGKPVDYFVA